MKCYNKTIIFIQKIQNMTKQENKAFTLVELIVVITILAVLATVAFISFQGYTSSSRDSVRLADLKNISKSFEINRTKDVDFPLPDKKIDISASGTIFQYQWELSQNILESDLNIFDGGLDPVTKKPYGYAVNLARNKFQIIWFLENQESVTNISQNTAFADNSDKFVKSSWDALGILLDEINNEVIIQSWSLIEIDIENTSEVWEKKLVLNTQILQGALKIWGMKNNSFFSGESNCNDLLKNNSQLQWVDDYYLLQLWNKKELVYCDMTSDGWGWTLYSGKWIYNLPQGGWLRVDKNMLNSIDYEKIRYNYVTPLWTHFPLIYKIFWLEEGNLILGHQNITPNIPWDNPEIHYLNNQQFVDAFEIWEQNTSTITLWNIQEMLSLWNHNKMMWWVWSNWWYHVVMWTTFHRYWDDYRKYFWFPASPYVGTRTIWNETFAHKELHETWDDGRSISIWIK